MKIVVVGGVAAGMSAAARARRLSEDAQIVVFEKDEYVSFANCGLPYHVGGDIEKRSALLLQTPKSLAANLALDVRTSTEVLSVDRAGHTVRVRELATGREYDESYDRLVLATGAAPIKPPLPGIDHPRVQTLRNVPDMDRVKALVDAGARHAVVVGGGYIGVEVAEAFAHRGVGVTLVELADQVMGPLDPEMAAEVADEMRAHGVEVRTGTGAKAFRPDPADTPDGTPGPVTVELSDGTEVVADVVLLAIGVVPDTRLHKAAGLELTPRGAVVVDAHMRTSDPDVYAAGDSVQVLDTVTGLPGVVPLAGPANRQGRIAADHIFGRPTRYASTQGTAIVKVFDLTAGGTGANEKTLRRLGVDYRKIYVHPNGHAGYYPGSAPMHLKLLFAPGDGRVLGAQVVGRDGVDKRIDVIAMAIRAGLTVYDLEEVELAYAPPFGSAKDPINMAGFQAANLLRGDVAFWHAEDWGAFPAGTQVLDVRTTRENAESALPGSINIPVQQLRERIGELDPSRPVRVYCKSGFRSYLAYRILAQRGFGDVSTLSGGTMTLRSV